MAHNIASLPTAAVMRRQPMDRSCQLLQGGRHIGTFQLNKYFLIPQGVISNDEPIATDSFPNSTFIYQNSINPVPVRIIDVEGRCPRPAKFNYPMVDFFTTVLALGANDHSCHSNRSNCTAN